MAKTTAGQAFGAVRRALFLDVPHILDRLLQWGEFTANRLGVVSFKPPWTYRQRPAWRMPVFALFVAVGAFLTFGPTADSLCLATGAQGMVAVSHVFGVLSGLAAAYLFFLISNRASLNLALDAEKNAEAILKQDPDRARLHARIDKQRRKYAIVVENTGIFSRWTVPLVSNFSRLLVACVFAPRRDALAYLIGTLALMLGTLLALTPLVSVALALLNVGPELPVCSKGSVTPLLWQFVSLVVVAALAAWIWPRCKTSLMQFTVATFLWVVLIGLLWGFVAPAGATEAQGGPYPHIYALLVAALLGAAVIARVIARRLFAGIPANRRKAFQDALANLDLIAYEREFPDVSGLRLSAALVNGVAQYFKHWLLLPAVAVFVAPSDWISVIAAVFVVISSILIMYGNLSSRWFQMLLLVERWFLTGTARLVSYVVIGIAALRLFGVQYVTTVMDAAPTGVLLVIVTMAYVAIWYHETWINRWLGESLLGLLGTKKDAERGWMNYRLNSKFGDTWAEKNGRVLALHAPGRFCAQGFFTRPTCREGERSPEFAFTSYNYSELFELLDPTEHREAAHDVQRRVRLYFTIVNVTLIAILAALAAWFVITSNPTNTTAVVTAKGNVAPATTAGDLAPVIARRAGGDRPVIVVAASGGGTRAAVYTAVALEGLGRLGVTHDIALLSGVSGGGVAVATYASRVWRLARTKPNSEKQDNPWTQYVNAMGNPFIQDVLEGIGELRIAGPAPLASLLEESLERRIFSGPVQTFGQLGDIGLILNTTVTGHPYVYSELLRDRVGAVETENAQPCVARPYASLAGGRLIFTNLHHVEAFELPPGAVPDMRLPYKIVRDSDVELAAGGALTANFPPVFSNARVQLKPGSESGCDSESWFVTDGGATENLGLVSALLAVESAIEPAVTQLTSEGRDASLPEIHVIAIEASAISYDYADDRGIGAATGGSKERINAGLTQRLIAKLDSRLAEHGGRLQVHYLTLPVVFRSRGGFGTHWMFAEEVQLVNPLLASTPGIIERVRRRLQSQPADTLTLTRPQVIELWRALYARDGMFCDEDRSRPAGWSHDLRRAADWVCGRDTSRALPRLKPDWQVKAWDELVQTLSGSAR